MPRKTMIEAIRDAMDVMMERDDNVVVFGEDVGFFGGVFRATQGLQAKYGKTPLLRHADQRTWHRRARRSAWRPTGCGPASRSSSPTTCIRPTTRSSPRRHGCATGRTAQFTCPLVVRMPTGGGIFGGQTHSQSPEALFTHVCGLKTVVPSNPSDAKGLLIAAIEDPDPVIFLEPKRLYNGPFDGHHDRPVTPWSKHELGEVPDGHYAVPLGTSAIRREGAALTILAYGTMVHVAMAAAAETGVDAEIIDLRTLLPLDLETIEASVRKTGRCVIVHEATLTSGFGAELSALVQETCFYHLEAPDRACRRLGHALSACAGMGLLPRSRPRRPRAARDDGGVRWREHVIRLPDVGEGIAEAELVEWHVKVGDLVREDTTLAAVMTDKATVEIPSPVDGEIIWLGAEIGDMVAVGSDLVRLKMPGETGRGAAAQAASALREARAAAKPAPDGEARARPTARSPSARRPHAARRRQSAPPAARRAAVGTAAVGAPRPKAIKPVASPAVRLRAREAGIDLRQVPGTGPAGRITHEDLDAFVARGPRVLRARALQPKSAVEDDQGDRAAAQDRREDGGARMRASRISPTSKRSMSRRSKSCGRRSTGESARSSRGSRCCRS